MDWIARHSSAIQAIASVVAVIIAGVLAGVTYWYVRVTREIARSSAEQVRQIRDSAKAAQRRNTLSLAAFAARIRSGLAIMDADAPRHDQLSEFNRVSDSDIARLEAITWQIDSADIASASNVAVGAMREILATVQDAKKIQRGAGWHLTNEQITRWTRAKEESDRALHAIENECEVILNG